MRVLQGLPPGARTKKVTKIEYELRVRRLLRSRPVATATVTYDECGNKKIVYTPTCGKVRTRTKLVKKETIEEVPDDKWVVEYLCPRLRRQMRTSDAAADGERPQQPTRPRGTDPTHRAAPARWRRRDSRPAATK